MKIIVDADACPVKELIIRCAKKHNLEVIMVCDVAHMLFYPEDFITVITVDQGFDSADLVIANRTQADDICITQDYGLASLLLAKKATVLHHNGFLYTQENIDRMLFERHLSREMRRQKRSRGGHVRKRTKEDDEKFLSALERAIQKNKTASL
ncbi:MAG: YaiI/YqxD family protein [Anaerotignum sp.]|nr:YaiI/YqxD family protein [Anaerotignum sp.]